MAATAALLLVLLTIGAVPASSSGAVVEPLLSGILSRAAADERIDAVVTFSRQLTASDLAALSGTGLRAVRLSRLPMAGIRGTKSQISATASIQGVVSIHHNRRLEYYLDESVPGIGADRVWATDGIVGRGSTVAVIDTGVDAGHPDLSFGSKVVQNVKVASDPLGLLAPLVLENQRTTDTTSGHGTHCASTIGGTGSASNGRYTGVAPGASLIGIGAGELITILHALIGFEWVLANRSRYGIDIVSNSWGSSGQFDAGDPINVATKAVHDAGVVVVFAAGNDGPGENTLNPHSVAPWVIGVAASTKDGTSLADFSSRGIPGDPTYHPAITAPGVGIVAARAATGLITLPAVSADLALRADALRYTTQSGTSMAAPHISGVAALVLEANPGLTPSQVKDVLTTTTKPMSGYAEHEVGAGFVDAFAAVNAAQSALVG